MFFSYVPGGSFQNHLQDDELLVVNGHYIWGTGLISSLEVELGAPTSNWFLGPFCLGFRVSSSPTFRMNQEDASHDASGEITVLVTWLAFGLRNLRMETQTWLPGGYQGSILPFN